MQIELNDRERDLIRAALALYRTDAHEALTYMQQDSARDKHGNPPRKGHVERAIETIKQLDLLRGRFE